MRYSSKVATVTTTMKAWAVLVCHSVDLVDEPLGVCFVACNTLIA